MADNIDTYKGVGIFIIVERLYSRDSPSWHGIGTALMQVHRMVYQLYRKQDVSLDGERITPESATLWQRIQILSGTQLVQQNSADNVTRFALDYAGSRFMGTPVSIGGLKSKKIPDFLTKEYALPTQRIMAYGRDPIPTATLYGRPDAKFVMGSGGKDDPIAAAKYDLKTKQLKLIDPNNELPGMMRQLTSLRAIK